MADRHCTSVSLSGSFFLIVLEAILHPLIEFVTETIGSYGVPAVFVLMLLESMGILIPSEAISPFAGYLVSEGEMSFLAAVSSASSSPAACRWSARLSHSPLAPPE